MSKVGNYPDPRDPAKQLNAFREGEIPVREGPANVPKGPTSFLSGLVGQRPCRQGNSQRQEEHDEQRTADIEIHCPTR
jgi:hypothetical protein